MNLDLDDPLGDLLSDGSNDSLFGIEPAKKSTVPKVDKKDEKPKTANKKMEQLFGIAEQPIKTTKVDAKTDNLPSSPIKNSLKQQKLQPRAQEHLETKSNDSLSSDLGFDPRKPKKKGNILDELLGISETTSTKAQLPSKTAARSENPSTSKAPISRQTTSETVSENVTVENTARKPGGRRQSAVAFSDPLGLFGSNEKERSGKSQQPSHTKNSRKSIAVASSEWLFADGSMTGGAPDKSGTFVKIKSSPHIQITSNSEDRVEDEPGSSNVTSLESKNTLTTQNVMRNPPQIMETLANEATNTLNNLKQQEFQLMVASQMKTQENVLIEMKNKQQELLKQQESQFNELLRKQIARQSELEEIIKNQQDRINSHIQALIASHAQAPLLDMFTGGGGTDKIPSTTATTATNNPLEKIELEGDVKRLEMEKLRLEDLLSNINDNHEKEIIMIEQSYKKRISLMEENLESMERRYKTEIEALETFHSHKIKSISDERENVISNFQSKIKMMEESHQNFIDKLKQSYESDLEMLKRHYEEMMQNIRKSKFMEFAIMEESSSYADMMKRASSHLQNASGDIQSLHDVLQEKLSTLERDRDIMLNSREKRLEEQQKLLERTREASEAERQKLLDLVQTLEYKLNAIEQRSDEEQWSLKQKLIAFEVERKSFEKEKEFLRNQIANDQQKVQELKQSQLNEHAKLLNEIEDERLKLQEEKARNEIAKTLNSRNADDTGRSRVEIDAAVKYAEDAAKQAEKERERLIEMQRQLEGKRHEMMDRENALRVKQSELENSIIRTKQREKHAENFLKQTKKTELMLMAKYQSLQKYTMELSERETRIAKEKLDINAEKLELQAHRKKLFDTRCSLCKIGDKANELKGIIKHQQNDINDDDDFDNINSVNNEKGNDESFGTLYKHEMNLMTNFAEDLENVPNLVDMNDDMLDSDLLMLKLDVINSMSK
ncbi:calponin homology domain-containing protein DDB_G0272472-like [Chironomus tepperi]|uniref:calponin homology domain-containing protein DDB_G0272472-like n=1 Tax=Chironomus tepperi TaxID=113505 RepID=UPI00391FBF38